MVRFALLVLVFCASSACSNPAPPSDKKDGAEADSKGLAVDTGAQPKPTVAPTCETVLPTPPKALGALRGTLCSPVKSGPVKGIMKIFVAKDDKLEGLFKGHRKDKPFECAFAGTMASGAFVAHGGREETSTTCRINGRLVDDGAAINGSINGRVLGKPIIATYSGQL